MAVDCSGALIMRRLILGGNSSKRLCLKNCSKCSPHQFYGGVCCVYVSKACMAMRVHSQFSSNPEGSASGLKGSFGKDSWWSCPAKRCLVLQASNFYQLPVQISIPSVQRVNTSAACNDIRQSENLSHCNRYFSLTATLSSWIVMALSAVPQVKIIKVTTAVRMISILLNR